LASRPKFEGKDLRPKDLSYISAPQSTLGVRQQNSNRDTKLLELAVTHTKQSPVTHPNRDTTRLFANRNENRSLRLPRPSPVRRRTTHLAMFPAIQNPKQHAKRRKTPKSDPQFLFRLETHPTLCFVQVGKILNEPMFRLETELHSTCHQGHCPAVPFSPPSPRASLLIRCPNAANQSDAARGSVFAFRFASMAGLRTTALFET
jgi:hypothetical protein